MTSILIAFLPFAGLLLWLLLTIPASTECDQPPLHDPRVTVESSVASGGIHQASEPDAAQPLAPSDRSLSTPVANYVTWPMPTFWILLLLGTVGTLAGSGGNAAGFAVALLLNPILWGAGYAFFQIGRLRCPHCRRGVPLGVNRDAAVGSTLTCPSCRNLFIKPAA